MREKVEERTHFSWDVKVPLLKETDHRCAHCGTPLNRYTNLTIDHVIPLNKGGTNDPENLTVLCEDCNTEKSDMILSPAVWYPYLCKAKKKLLMDRMQKYMKETDYLAPDCLLPIDSFRIEVPVTTKKKSRTAMNILSACRYTYGESGLTGTRRLHGLWSTRNRCNTGMP